MAVFWIVTLCDPVEVNRRFGDACCDHPHDYDSNTSETSVKSYQTTRHNDPEDGHHHIRRSENLKPQ
jgi:hypothetical protein